MERYNKIKLIGSGTFGQAWLVQSVVSYRNYALKELGVSAMSEQDRHLALNEAKILSKLKHKNIVRYKEAFVAEGKLCIAMEFAEQGDLYTRIKERNGTYFPEMQILDWFTQLCLALKYIHGQNILHRDLKTQNIFLSKDDVIKLGDFGIARMLNNTLDHAQTTVGTPYYLSPEMCQRKPYNHKSDMWSLGCVLYEMATLKHAFNANNFSALVITILHEQYPPIPRVYGPLLEDLVSVLLQKDPEDRPSAKQILYVPAMQPYVKRFLLGERERVDSVASGVYDASSRSVSNCSQRDNKDVNRDPNGFGKAQRVKSLGDEQLLCNNTFKPEEHSCLTDNRPNKVENIPASTTTEEPVNSISVSRNALHAQENESTCNNKIAKPRKSIAASENLLKLRARLRSRFSIGAAHAQERRYSEQNLTCGDPGPRTCKERIFSHGAQIEENSQAEDDVFVKNQVTVVPFRIPNSKNVINRAEQMLKSEKENSSYISKQIPEHMRKRQKPALSVCQPRRNERIPTKKRHQSDMTALDRERCPKQQSQRKLTSQSGCNDKENIGPSSANARVIAKPRVPCSALKEIQPSKPEKGHTREIGNQHVGGKGTYTVSNRRKLSEHQIPEVDGKNRYNYENRRCEYGMKNCDMLKQDCKTTNEKATAISGTEHCKLASVSEGCKHCSLRNEKQSHSNEHFRGNNPHFNLKNREPEAKAQRSPHTPSCKFTLCGKTLRLDNVSSDDSVYSHTEALRMHLEEKLGTRLLTAVYRYVTNVSGEKDQRDDDRVKRTVECILGEHNMVYFPVLLQLVACDARYYH